jgi:threonine synthase
VIEEYREWLPVDATTPVVTLGEGGTPLLAAPYLSEATGCDVYVKVEGMNPTGSFKDRGMTVAVSLAKQAGAQAVICASTGNTSASAAAYAARAGMTCAVLIPAGKIAMGKLAQALAHGATQLEVEGNFDDCLRLARELAEGYPVALVNSVNRVRLQGQKTAALEIVDVLGDAPDIHAMPVGNAGNISAYWAGYQDYAKGSAHADQRPTHATRVPRMFGFQAAGAAPIVNGAPVLNPETVATAIRIGNPASWELAVRARDDSEGLIEAVTDEEILAAHRLLSAREGIFVEPASAAGYAGILKLAQAGRLDRGQTIAITVTGHGLKDPDWAVKAAPPLLPPVAAEVTAIAGALSLA